jgi:ATPase family associated with various cellular activities (AAA)
MKNAWDEVGSEYWVSRIANQVSILPNAVFVVKMHPNGPLYLEKLDDKFVFPFKVYGIEEDFIKRVKKTYENTNSNLGVLLNGLKGTGKTITAELICNVLNLPVVIVNVDYPNLVNFMNDIQQDVLFFFDEFEKVFPNDHKQGSKLLTIMDGALKSKFRKVFLLTTNQLYVEDNLLQRPGRIRYLKTFRNLSLDTIIKIIDDKLIHPARRGDLIKFISQLETITVDIVSSIVQEVNTHDESTDKYLDFFNVRRLVDKTDVYKIVFDKVLNKNTEILFRSGVTLNPSIPYTDRNIIELGTQYIGYNLKADQTYLGVIVEVKEDGIVITEFDQGDDENQDENEEDLDKILSDTQPEGENAVVSLVEKPKKKKRGFTTYRLVRALCYNTSFSSYKFS